MTLIIDTAPLVALADARDPLGESVEEVLASDDGPLVIPAPVSAEADYLIGRRVGQHSRRCFLEDLAAGRFVVPCLELGDYSTIVALESRYSDLDAGLADLSVVVMAQRYGTHSLLTFDQRDFRVLRGLDDEPFTLLPTDG